MEVITCHTNADLDSLGSMVAASKLYPRAKLCFSGKTNREVRNFLSLHKNAIPVQSIKDIEIEKITKIIVVDTNAKDRVPLLDKVLSKGIDVEVIVYDHHPMQEDSISYNQIYHRFTGSCTALIVNILESNNIDILPFEATVMALGIYSDTNCLTFTSTTTDDAKAVAFLLLKGANLSVVTDFMGQPLTDEQRNLMTNLINSSCIYNKSGISIAIVKGESENYIGELSFITHKILDIKNTDCIFAIVKMDDKVQVVAKSSVDFIDINEIMTALGGGGHKKAGSASIKGLSVDDIKEQLLDLLDNTIKPPILAKDIMSSPVKTVFEDITINEVYKIMLRYGHTGLPVLERRNKRMIGIISRTDVDKAIHHNLGHAPVKGYMSRNIITIGANTPLKELQELLISHNIGRLPVMENDNLIGIVTRTNVISILHGESYPKTHRQLYIKENNFTIDSKDIKSKLSNIDPSFLKMFKTISVICGSMDCRCYVVGGFVRDLILGSENYDIDIVVEGDAISLAKKFSEQFNGKLTIHDAFKTAVVSVSDEIKIDFVTARREYYNYPGALPSVERSNLWYDLYRRDFTINCMAIDITQDNYGELIDFFGGFRDLLLRKIRILYNFSFVEDPTRIFRAIRFEQRLGFEIEKESLHFAKYAVNSNVLSKISFERILHEIRLILKEDNYIQMLDRMVYLRIWQNIFNHIKLNQQTLVKLKKCCALLDEIKQNSKNTSLDRLILMLSILCLDNRHKDIISFLASWNLKNGMVEDIYDTVQNYQQYIKILEGNNEIEKLKFINNSSDYRLSLLALPKAEQWDEVTIIKIINKLKNIKISITGIHLMKLGIKQGAVYKKIFDEVLEQKLKGNLHTLEDELDYVKKMYL